MQQTQQIVDDDDQNSLSHWLCGLLTEARFQHFEVPVAEFIPRGPVLQVPLTEREQEIARLVAAGQMSKEIAASLNLSVRTVEKHRANIMEKVGVREVASLTRWCIQAGLVDA